MADGADYSFDYENQKLLYDLRMTWAWVMHHYDQLLFNYKVQNNYYGIYTTMKKMWPKVLGRVKRKSKKTRDDFVALDEEVKEVLVRHKGTYTRTKPTEEGVQEISDALDRMELFIELTKEKNNMYGTQISESVI